MSCCCPPSPSDTPPMESPRVKVEEEWTPGTFTLVSADGEKFSCLPCKILGASETFRSAQHSQYTFTHPEDTPETIRRFLTLLHTGNVGPTQGWDDCTLALELLSLFRFLQRYDCNPWFQIALMSLRDKVLRSEVDVLPVFIVGAVLNCVFTCAFAIQHAPAESWGETSEDANVALDSGADGIPCLDPRGMPLKLWELLPREYGWALSRAWVGKEVGWPRVHEGVARDFKELIEAAQARQSNKRQRTSSP